MATMSLSALPVELLTYICSYLLPDDIVHLGATCRQAKELTRPSNNLLWQRAFMHLFDDPRHGFTAREEIKSATSIATPSISATYWHDRLQRRCRALKAIHPDAYGSYDEFGTNAEEIMETILDIIDTAKPGPTSLEIAAGERPQIDDRRSLNLQILSPIVATWSRLENLIHDCHVPDDDEDPPNIRVTRSYTMARKNGPRSDAAKKLHVLYGKTTREQLEYGAKDRARRIVYNWNTPTAVNEWGPLKKDGSGEVDWTILEADASVMLRQFEMGTAGRLAMPQGFCYALPHRTLMDPTTPDDSTLR